MAHSLLHTSSNHFWENKGVKHVPSSPYFAQSNGLVERMVQTVKNSLKKALTSGHTLLDVLSTLRSTPFAGGLPSPAVLMQCRNLRDNLYNSVYQLQHVQVHAPTIIEMLQKRQGNDHISNSGTKSRAILFPGQQVYCRRNHREWVPAEIVGHANTPNSYLVRLESGAIVRRNGTFLKPRKGMFRAQENSQVQNICRSSIAAPQLQFPGQQPRELIPSAITNNTSTHAPRNQPLSAAEPQIGRGDRRLSSHENHTEHAQANIQPTVVSTRVDSGLLRKSRRTIVRPLRYGDEG